MKRSFLVIYDLEPHRLCDCDADDVRENLLDSCGFPSWLETPGALTVTQIESTPSEIAADWFTLPPTMRTKARLIEMLENNGEYR